MKYDVIIPIGSSCVSAFVLKELGLRKQSLPFDWLTPISLDMAVSFIENQFENLLTKEHLEEFSVKTKKHISYRNNKLGINFYHDFAKGDTFENQLVIVKDKYNRRIKRLFNLIDKNKNILLIHIAEELKLKTIYDDDYIREQFEKIKNLYPSKNIDLIFINLVQETTTKNTRRTQVSRNIVKYDIYRKPDFAKIDIDYHNYMPDIKNALFDINLSFNIKYALKIVINYMINIMPSKRLRRRLKDRYL